MTLTRHCHSLPREVVESSSSEIFRRSLDTIQGNWLEVALLKLEVALLKVEVWARWPPEDLVNLSCFWNSVIIVISFLVLGCFFFFGGGGGSC